MDGDADVDALFILEKAAVSVAQAAAMASVGVFFTRTGVIDDATRKVLAKISMQVTIPCLLFSSVLTCPQEGSEGTPHDDRCPELLVTISSAWQFLFLPLLWVLIGFASGALATRIGRAPAEARLTMIAACGFSNSTGLPITLLTALSVVPLREDAAKAAQLRSFLLLLAIYQVTYPVIQWGLGGWIMSRQLQPPEEQRSEIELIELGQEGEDVSQPTRLQRCCDVLRVALVPPVVAVLLGVSIGISPTVRGWFVDTRDYNNDSYLEFFFNAIESFGKAAVPLNMLVLGSTLAKVPGFRSFHWPSVLAVSFAKLVVHPAAAFALIYLFSASGLLAATVDASVQAEFVLVACLLTATPTANNLAVLAESYAGAEAKKTLASLIFVMYCIAPFTVTAWIFAFLSLARMQTQ